MKKLFIWFMVAALAFPLCACSSGETEETDPGGMPQNTAGDSDHKEGGLRLLNSSLDQNGCACGTEKPIDPASSRSSCSCAGSSNTARSARSSSSIELPQQRLCLLCVQDRPQKLHRPCVVALLCRVSGLTQPLSAAGRQQRQQLPSLRRPQYAPELLRGKRMFHPATPSVLK